MNPNIPQNKNSAFPNIKITSHVPLKDKNMEMERERFAKNQLNPELHKEYIQLTLKYYKGYGILTLISILSFCGSLALINRTDLQLDITMLNIILAALSFCFSLMMIINIRGYAYIDYFKYKAIRFFSVLTSVLAIVLYVGYVYEVFWYLKNFYDIGEYKYVDNGAYMTYNETTRETFVSSEHYQFKIWQNVNFKFCKFLILICALVSLVLIIFNIKFIIDSLIEAILILLNKKNDLIVLLLKYEKIHKNDLAKQEIVAEGSDVKEASKTSINNGGNRNIIDDSKIDSKSNLNGESEVDPVTHKFKQN